MRILDNYHVTKPSLSSDPTPTTPKLHSSNKEAKEVEDVVDKKKGWGEATCQPAPESTPGEAEAQAMQVQSQGHLEETPPR
jgi:hypothetical protein